jgi:HAD superfamily phosphatase (TIGR01681 family)
MSSDSRRIAIFDLDLTLTTRHLWKDLGYHRRAAADLGSQTRETWLADLGGAESFEPERLRGLFDTLANDGFTLALATYNKETVARAFLDVFVLRSYFANEMILSRDTADGSKLEYSETLARRIGAAGLAGIRGLYFDDSREECENVKASAPHWRVFYVERPLSAPNSALREIGR